MTWNVSWTSSIFKPNTGLIFLALLFLSVQSFGFVGKEDSIAKSVVFVPDTSHSPKKAVILSAILPGAGQIYNDRKGSRNWWKVPIIYAGLGSLGYSFGSNNSSFKTWNSYYLERDRDATAHSDTTHEAWNGRYTLASLESISNTYRRRRDLSVIGFVLVYTLNLIDASVYGHLYNFDVSKDISLHWNPTVIRSTYQAQRPTFGLSLSLRL